MEVSQAEFTINSIPGSEDLVYPPHAVFLNLYHLGKHSMSSWRMIDYGRLGATLLSRLCSSYSLPATVHRSRELVESFKQLADL